MYFFHAITIPYVNCIGPIIGLNLTTVVFDLPEASSARLCCLLSLCDIVDVVACDLSLCNLKNHHDNNILITWLIHTHTNIS
jgi:hypothetical protein